MRSRERLFVLTFHLGACRRFDTFEVTCLIKDDDYTSKVTCLINNNDYTFKITCLVNDD